MKAEELMVGDWVFYNGVPTMVSEKDFSDIERIKKMEPISITKERLEKNGFKTCTGIDYILDCGDELLDFYPHENKLRMLFNGTDEWDNHSKAQSITFLCYVFFIHELQHALRLMYLDKQIKL